MQVLVPLKVSDAMVEMIGEPENLKPGDTLSAKEDIAIGFRHLVVYEEGEYFIPLFTSEEEVNKGESTSIVNQSLKKLIDAIDNWPKCLQISLFIQSDQSIVEEMKMQHYWHPAIRGALIWS